MTLRNMEILFRIRVCQMEYSSFSFLVLWRLGLSIGTLLQRVKVVCFLQLYIMDWLITGLQPYLLILWRGQRGIDEI